MKVSGLCDYIPGKTCVGLLVFRGKVQVILPTCLCCKTEAWLSLLLEAIQGNVFEDPVFTLVKEGGSVQCKDLGQVFKIKQTKFSTIFKKKKSIYLYHINLMAKT